VITTGEGEYGEFGRYKKNEPNVSPLTAEYRPQSGCSTQNKAKRTNKMVFRVLVRDQEVGGSNPLGPMTCPPIRTKLSMISEWLDL